MFVKRRMILLCSRTVASPLYLPASSLLRQTRKTEEEVRGARS
jgi:hypothetical protein